MTSTNRRSVTMYFRHRTSKAVVEAEESPGVDWEPITGPSSTEPPSDPSGPESVIQDAPTAEPIRDLTGLDRDQLLALADREGIDVNRRLGLDRLAAQIIAAAPTAPPLERDLAPNT